MVSWWNARARADIIDSGDNDCGVYIKLDNPEEIKQLLHVISIKIVRKRRRRINKGS